MLRLKYKEETMNIIQIYVPMADPKYKDEVRTLYESIQKLIDTTKPREITIMMEDFNVKVGVERKGNTAGPFDLGSVNQRGEHLIQSWEQNELAIMNT